MPIKKGQWSICSETGETIHQNIDKYLSEIAPARTRGGGNRSFYVLDNPRCVIKSESLTSLGKWIRYFRKKNTLAIEFEKHVNLHDAGINVAEAFAYGRHGNNVYLVLERIDNPVSAHTAVMSDPPENINGLSDFIIDLAVKNILQCDANTGNFLLDCNGNWWLADLRHVRIGKKIEKSDCTKFVANITGWFIAQDVSEPVIHDWVDAMRYKISHNLPGEDVNFDIMAHATKVSEHLLTRRRSTLNRDK